MDISFVTELKGKAGEVQVACWVLAGKRFTPAPVMIKLTRYLS